MHALGQRDAVLQMDWALLPTPWKVIHGAQTLTNAFPITFLLFFFFKYKFEMNAPHVSSYTTINQ